MPVLIEKTHVNFDRNVGGLNFGSTENSAGQFELVDGHNFDLVPSGGYRKRRGMQVWTTNYIYYSAVYNDDTGESYQHAVIRWCAPSTSSYLLFVNTAKGLMRMYRPHPTTYESTLIPVEQGLIYRAGYTFP